MNRVVRFTVSLVLGATSYCLLCNPIHLWGRDGQGATLDEESYITPSLGLPFPVFPSDNPPSLGKIRLGRRLFFDKRLSRDNSVSCATCHDPNYGFADPHAVSVGPEGRSGHRNAPTVLNAAFFEPMMWDGRARSLEEQALLPFESPVEFDLPIREAEAKLRRQGYSEDFKTVFGRDVNAQDLAHALATYQRSLLAGDSPFDRFLFRKEEKAISSAAKRGFDTFLRAKCDACHLVMTPHLHPFGLRTVLFTDNKFHNLGVGTDQKDVDPGRYAITGEAADWGAFRTPSLRNVALTAPYFHDGSARTLAEVVEFYDRGGKPNRYLDKGIQPLNLSPQDKGDMVAFLESLTSTLVADYTQEETKTDCRANKGEPGLRPTEKP
jgi:cytochrome c peroxidase